MPHTSNNQHSPRTPGEAFIDRRSIVLARANLIVNTRDLLSQQPLPMEKREVAFEQAAKAVEHETKFDLPLDVAQSPDLVAWAQQKKAESYIQQAQQAVELARTEGTLYVNPTETQSEASVTRLQSPEEMAALRAIEEIHEEVA